jgi:Alr-MurF fusion protein
MNTLEQLRNWCNGQWLEKANDVIIENLLIDSRKITQPESSLFIALKTNLRDGHHFIPDAYDSGVRSFLVSQEIDCKTYPGANFVLVKNTLTALQQMAAAHRKQFQIPVVGITGSNGKTMVKEWLYQLLSGSFNTIRSPKSYNSQVGVPLSVWLMEQAHQLAIFEAGISQPGEMDKLEKIILPTIGIFTNIGEAHSEGFVNTRQKINEKLLLFRHTGTLVYCRDHAELNENVVQFMSQVRGGAGERQELFTWSQKHDATLRITQQQRQLGTTHIKALYKGEEIAISIPFTDSASIENAIHCWCTMLLLGVAQQVIEERMRELQPVSMRLELMHGINDCVVINDTYNSDLTSLQLALDYLEQQKQLSQHTLILSDMLQIGKPDSELYEEVAQLVHNRSIQRFIGIGPALFKNKAAFRKYKKPRSIFFKSTEEFLKKFHLVTFQKEAILLKGARIFEFEKISLLLEQKVHQTVMTVNLSALTHNLNVFRAQLKPGVRTMAMVKAFAYGAGSYEIAHALQYAGVDYLGVAYTEEGISLRKAGITMPIMIMSPDATSFDRMVAWKLEPEIYNFRSLQAFIDIATTLQVKSYPVHIKLDTGMHRLGFNEQDVEALAEVLKNTPQIHVASIFSHLAASEDPAQDDFTSAQAALFDRLSAALMKAVPGKPLRHLCNSAGAARRHDLHYDMVRLGLGLYGIDSSHEVQAQLRHISTLKTMIAQIRDIKEGDNIGYGHTTLAPTAMRIATICIGYADGYQRILGKAGSYVLIQGKPAAIMGSICMDMCMVDVTNIPDAKEGDEAIVFGPDLPVSQLAAWAGTIPYEIMTGISQRVKRVFVNE